MKQIKFWKKSILILTCAALIAGGTVGLLYKEAPQEIVATPAPEWQSYSASDQSFAIQFPAEPTEKTEQAVIAGKSLEFQEVTSAINESTYSVSYVDFPKHWKWIGTNKLLSKGFDAFIQSEQNVEALVKQQITTFNGLPTLEYHLKQAGKEIEGKFVIVGNTLYRMTVTYPLAVAETVQPDTFFSSFQANG